MNWHDTPPTKAGTYWVKTPLGDEEPIHLAPDGSWWYADHPKARANVGGCQFGNRIPTNAELGELPGLIEEYGTLCIEDGMFDAGQAASSTVLARIKEILGVAE